MCVCVCVCVCVCKANSVVSKTAIFPGTREGNVYSFNESARSVAP